MSCHRVELLDMRINYIRLWAYLLISGTNEETLYHNFLQVTLGQGAVPVRLPSKGYWKYYLIRNGLKFGEVKNKTELNIKIEPHLHDKLVYKWHQRKHFLFLLLIFFDFFFFVLFIFFFCVLRVSNHVFVCVALTDTTKHYMF